MAIFECVPSLSVGYTDFFFFFLLWNYLCILNTSPVFPKAVKMKCFLLQKAIQRQSKMVTVYSAVNRSGEDREHRAVRSLIIRFQAKIFFFFFFPAPHGHRIRSRGWSAAVSVSTYVGMDMYCLAQLCMDRRTGSTVGLWQGVDVLVNQATHSDDERRSNRRHCVCIKYLK